MKFSDLKKDKGIIFRYIITGIGGPSLGALIGILIGIIYGIFFDYPRNYEPFYWMLIPSIFGFGGAFFGIASKDKKRIIHYGLVGIFLGAILTQYFVDFNFNYYQPFIILSLWGLAIGLPEIKSAIASALVGLAGGTIIVLLVIQIKNLSIDLNFIFTLIPTFTFFFFLIVGSIIGLITYTAEKCKKVKPSFNDKYILVGFLTGIIGLKSIVIILTVIAVFIVGFSSHDPVFGMEYQIDIVSTDQEKYSITLPFLIKRMNYTEVLKNASISGNAKYHIIDIVENKVLVIEGNGNSSFKVYHEYNEKYEDIQIYYHDNTVFSGIKDIYFEGIKGSVNISMEGRIGDLEGSQLTFNIKETELKVGSQEIEVESGMLWAD